MPRESGRNDRRSKIAYLAARLMAEDGIEDYALAKRKAARQSGAPDPRELPSNEEIDLALRTYQQIYHPEEYRDRLRQLRETALHVMRTLARFNPYLTGPVLTGHAGKYADIHLQLFTESAKAVELYLIGQGLSYRTSQRRFYCGAEPLTAPIYVLDEKGVAIELTVFSPRELRVTLRTSVDGKVIDRAKPAAVEQLLAQT